MFQIVNFLHTSADSETEQYLHPLPFPLQIVNSI